MQTAALTSGASPGGGQFEKTSTREELASRLTRRSYMEISRLVGILEYSIRIQSGAASSYFPLGSADPQRAAEKAGEIEACVLAKGWDATIKIYPREITVAVFWVPSPLCCTYTTVYSIPEGVPERWQRIPLQPDRNCRTIVIHPEKAVRDSLRFWIDREPGFVAVDEFGSLEDFLGLAAMPRSNLVLVERGLMEKEGGIPLARLRQQFPGMNIFGFGVYEESNYIFHSVTGVRTGYILCRRQPLEWFEPIKSLGKRPRMPAQVLNSEINRFFKTLFQRDAIAATGTGAERLTAREHDVLVGLARGFTEKEVAASLQLSPLTVHNHVKRIYGKLDVHSRTEAVVKFLRTSQDA
jgi:DNA-binding NarL/FixJ family response regulator